MKESHIKVSELMTSNPECCTPDDLCLDAAQIMERRDVGCVPLIESQDTRRLVGCVTDRDLVVRVIASGLDAADTELRHVMTDALVTCSPEDDACACEALMKEHQVRRVFVTDDQGALLGIVATADLARQHEPAHVGETIESISMPTGANPTA